MGRGKLRKSQRNDSKLSRFAYYKYSGIIVFAPIIIFAIGLYVYMDDQQEFYSAWSCETINSYLLGEDVPEEIPLHNSITEKQHVKLHQIYDECSKVQFLSMTPHA